jgi:glycerophosphoryl diester phosphodiesterase
LSCRGWITAIAGVSKDLPPFCHHAVWYKTVFSSFQSHPVALLKKEQPVARIGPLRRVLLSEHPTFGREEKMGVEFIALHHRAITASNVEMTHKAGLKVTAWTANEADEVRGLDSICVDVLTPVRYLEMVEMLDGGW